MSKTKIASDFIRENSVDGVCKYSKKKAGEIIHHKYPDLFKSPEDARFYIRLITNANGKNTTARAAKEHIVEWKGVKLPKPEKNDYSKVIVNQKRIGILSDIHFPYYDESALNITLKYLKKWSPDCLIFNGDIIDCYHLSDHEKDKRQRSFKYELDMLRSFFVQITDEFKGVRIIYKIGNHEERYERQILKNIPELIEMEYFHFENVIESKKHGIEVVKNKRIIKIGKLNVVHGHEFARGMAAPVNPARGFFLKAKSNVIGGHHHQTSEHPEPNINGEIIGAWSLGSLCDLHPHYMPINKWNHGFATVEVLDNEGNFRVDNKKINNGQIV